MRRRSDARKIPLDSAAPDEVRYPWDLPRTTRIGGNGDLVGGHQDTPHVEPRALEPPKRRGRPPGSKNRNQYAYGRTIEWAVRSELRNRGYHVIRSSGSKGNYDLLAGKLNETWAIQVKGQKPTPAEFQAIVDASQDWWVPHAIVWRNKDIIPTGYGPVLKRWESRVYFRGEGYTKQKFPGTSDEIESQFALGEPTDA